MSEIINFPGKPEYVIDPPEITDEQRAVLTKTLDAREKIRNALMTIIDSGTSIDSGAGMGGFDLWIKIDGVEYYLHCQSRISA